MTALPPEPSRLQLIVYRGPPRAGAGAGGELRLRRRQQQFDQLPGEVVAKVLQFCAARDVLQLSCTSAFWHRECMAETLWHDLCMDDFGVSPASFRPPKPLSKLVYQEMAHCKQFLVGVGRFRSY